MKVFSLLLALLSLYGTAYGTLAGGRLNAFSEGQNAFAGVINPANAVWIHDRVDVGIYWVHQNARLNNKDNNPLFPRGNSDLTYKSKNIVTADLGVHKQFPLKLGSKTYDSSLSLATYTTPSTVKVRTKKPFPGSGTTPIQVQNKTEVVSAVFSLKLSPSHSLGISVDYFYLSHKRNGYQNSDNPLRSVSPGHVTNKGIDHSNGLGLSVGWRWRISEKLNFGVAWSRKSYCGRYKKYRGFEPHHGENYIPQLVGAGLSYRFTTKIAGRLEVLWNQFGNLPNANSNVLPNGNLNLHKRGSRKSPGPGLQDATFINLGLGYRVNSELSVGTGFSHRIKLPQKRSNILSHTYTLQTIYNTISLGANLDYGKHDLFLGFIYGFRNRTSGDLPKAAAGGGKIIGEKQTMSMSFSWGYLY